MLHAHTQYVAQCTHCSACISRRLGPNLSAGCEFATGCPDAIPRKRPKPPITPKLHGPAHSLLGLHQQAAGPELEHAHALGLARARGGQQAEEHSASAVDLHLHTYAYMHTHMHMQGCVMHCRAAHCTRQLLAATTAGCNTCQ